MTDLVQAHVVKHHVAHERIFTDAAPDAGPESILVGPHGNRSARMSAHHPGIHAPERGIRGPRQPRKSQQRSVLMIGSLKSQRAAGAALPLFESPQRQLTVTSPEL